MGQLLPFRTSDADGTSAPATPGRSLLGDVLVRSGAIARGDLDAALALQREQDAPLGRILKAQRAVSPKELAEALSAQSGLDLVDLASQPADPALLSGIDPYMCLQLEALPWRDVDGARVIAVSNPSNGRAAVAAFGGGSARIELVLADAEQVRKTVEEGFRDQMGADALVRCPERFSCRGLGGRCVRGRTILAAMALLASVVAAPLVALQLLMGWILVANFMTTGLRLVAIFAKFRKAPPKSAVAASTTSDPKKLPQVSILVPLLHEEAIADKLLRAMEEVDYPDALLDIKLVIEEDDTTTREALARAELPGVFEIVTVPAGALKTKPRAMNYALPLCRGSIVGVYDAEDRPDPQQIRMVVQHLAEAPPEVACVQGYLDFYNSHQNWLSRCFTIEYAVWFRVLLHGVQRLGVPIPLGGTTVFFRRHVLEEIGAWDAHNVTEDADLGMRLARFGYRCEMIDSTTCEEANCRVLPWIKQRSRWLKGYAITWATHMRRPGTLLQDLGWKGFLGFQVLFLGTITSYLSMPLFWLIWTGTVGFDLSFWRTLPEPLMWSFLLSMMLGQAVMLSVAAIAIWDLGRLRMVHWIVTLPLYWPMGAVAAYQAIGEIFYAPFYWHKTEHGFARELA